MSIKKFPFSDELIEQLRNLEDIKTVVTAQPMTMNPSMAADFIEFSFVLEPTWECACGKFTLDGHLFCSECRMIRKGWE